MHPEPRDNDGALLAVRDLHAFYGQSHVLHGISFELRRGEVTTLLGRNGAGKTTTLRALMGLVRRSGSIRHEGTEISAQATFTIARRGIGYVPEERGIFSTLTVRENLLLPPVVRPGGLTVDEIHDLFPNLRERSSAAGWSLSGGEQQMLAMGRVLRTGADLLLLDEVSEGLAPVIVEQIGAAINVLKQRGMTILMVEQDFEFAQSVADRHCMVEHGRVVDEIPNHAVHDPTTHEKVHSFLGL